MEWKSAELREGCHLVVVAMGDGDAYAAQGEDVVLAYRKALEQAARESDEARYELGVHLGIRGGYVDALSRVGGAEDDE